MGWAPALWRGVPQLALEIAVALVAEQRTTRWLAVSACVAGSVALVLGGLRARGAGFAGCLALCLQSATLGSALSPTPRAAPICAGAALALASACADFGATLGATARAAAMQGLGDDGVLPCVNRWLLQPGDALLSF